MVDDDVESMPTYDEAEAMRKQFNMDVNDLKDIMAKEHLSRTVVFMEWGTDKLTDKINETPMMSDGAARLFIFNAGTDCTKDPPTKTN
eukprot:7040268-Alexandrium_andersonii.AAC.1